MFHTRLVHWARPKSISKRAFIVADCCYSVTHYSAMIVALPTNLAIRSGALETSLMGTREKLTF